MNASATLAPEAAAEAALPSWLTLLLAGACGLIVANIYYAQPLIGPISAELGLSPAAAGLIVTMTQIGYGAGLLLVVPLGDLVENRRLVLAVMGLAVLGVVVAAAAGAAPAFLLASLVIGFGSVAVQILVPYAAHLAPERMRGQVVGNVMSGLMLGIMLARPLASFVTALWSWHAMFWISALAMLALGMVLRLALPPRRPNPALGYAALLRSMGRLARGNLVLRRRALYQAGLFGAFSLFWTATPLLLTGPQFGLTQRGVALFALAGVAGAIAAPIAGRVADRGWTRPATGLAMLAVASSFLMTRVAEPGSPLALGLLVAAAVLLDFGVSANVVLGQRAIFSLGAEFRSRLNGLYMATFFTGGALGSALGGWSYATGGWPLTAWVGLALPVLALLYYATERRSG
ncbi:MFS transporter [Roseomonas sp. M0104]|uniref:MFS transporter n=1 Tax=Teichococcus coralli TaxID=2545983 RepID=A0A845BFN9_9PROT|nr:MFS transporter [Pseudoroseomonas coralli]MXP62299.1 MFS transporter [Pseudoroseomonas coralli]